MTRFVLICSLFIVACGDEDPARTLDASLVAATDGAFDAPHDAGPTIDGAGRDASVAEQCVDVRAKWNALVKPLAQTCDAPSDCAIVGARGVRSCEAYPQLAGSSAGEAQGDCNGVPVNAAALAAIATQVRALEQSFGQSCVNDHSLCTQQGITCVADCAPGGTLTCIDHKCGLTRVNSCIRLPPDAGP